jgi:UDP-glucose 4-epimerase
MRVLVTGGAGYIGSVITDQLLKEHTVVVYDNLSKGHRESVASDAVFVNGDLLDETTLIRTLTAHKIDAVMHMAASSIVGESMVKPETYYQNNVVASLNLFRAMMGARIRILVFSSTAAIYGEPERQPIVETDVKAPSNTYGETKLAVERALHWHHAAHGMRYVALRYFNAAGATSLRGERHDPETHLIPLVLRAARDPSASVTIFGDDYPTRDGTCVRDYVHVADLARAHVSALEALVAGEIEQGEFNLGCGAGYTVKEVVDTAERITGRTITVVRGARRPGDPAVLVASADKIKHVLGWIPKQGSLDDIVESAWAWEVSRQTPDQVGSSWSLPIRDESIT